VSVINTTTESVVGFIDIDGVPFSPAITPDGAKLYVGNGRGIRSSEDGPGIVWVIDTFTDTVSKTITSTAAGDDFDLAERVHGVAITPNGAQAWVTLNEAGKIGAISVATDQLTTTLGPIDPLHPCVDGNSLGCAHGIAITPDGSKAYVTMGGISDKVAVFNLTTNMLAGTITVGSAPFGIAITPCAPTVTVAGISGPVDPVQVGTNINTSANFTDSDVSEVHTAEWDWGDGSTSPGTVSETNGSGSVTGSHPYTTAGVYTVTLTVTDNSGCPGQALFQFVVVYDPSAGFVTGGGWIASPEGSYTPDPLLTGKANFGFVSKYKKGATVPTGQTEFQFRVANLNFHSTSYQWLVIAGAKAKYKGSGTINGSGDYGFLLTATDGQVNGGGGVDKFRIKIWDKATNDEVVYDNQLGDPDDGDATDVIEGGSIVIHKK
jgi:YVTN family beta-propeller protein